MNLSNVDLDGSHTGALKGGEEITYLGRRKRKKTDVILFSDRQDIPLAISTPTSGNRNDIFDIEKSINEIVFTLKKQIYLLMVYLKNII